MILEHFDELEADFLRFYDVDLPAAIWGAAPMSARRISALVAALPPDSATARVLDPTPGWGNVEELLAILNEQVDAANRMFLAVHSDKGSRPPKPLKIPRPGALGATTAVPSMSPPEEVARFFGRGYDPTRAG